jgi:hypothetical protein
MTATGMIQGDKLLTERALYGDNWQSVHVRRARHDGQRCDNNRCLLHQV